jgi:hypothetical protein
VLRVLHRLRSLSVQTPLDSATFSYAFPLLFQVIQKRGIGSGEDDEPLEQVSLSLDIIKFHCGECTSISSDQARSSTHELLRLRCGCRFPTAPNHTWIVTRHAHSAKAKQRKLISTYRSRSGYLWQRHERRNRTLTQQHPCARSLRPECQLAGTTGDPLNRVILSPT